MKRLINWVKSFFVPKPRTPYQPNTTFDISQYPKIKDEVQSLRDKKFQESKDLSAKIDAKIKEKKVEAQRTAKPVESVKPQANQEKPKSAAPKMNSIKITFTNEYTREGTLFVLDSDNSVMKKFKVRGDASKSLATLNGNASRDSSKPFGHAPFGRFTLGKRIPKEGFGPRSAVVLNGSLRNILIEAGNLNVATDGSIRLSHNDYAEFEKFLPKNPQNANPLISVRITEDYNDSSFSNSTVQEEDNLDLLSWYIWWNLTRPSDPTTYSPKNTDLSDYGFGTTKKDEDLFSDRYRSERDQSMFGNTPKTETRQNDDQSMYGAPVSGAKTSSNDDQSMFGAPVSSARNSSDDDQSMFGARSENPRVSSNDDQSMFGSSFAPSASKNDDDQSMYGSSPISSQASDNQSMNDWAPSGGAYDR